MKTFFKKFAVFLAIIAAVSITSSLVSSNSVSARGFGSCDPTFAGLVPWDCQVGEMNSEDALVTGIAQIATNILTDITVVAAYLIIGYVIYAGYLYMFSSGNVVKATDAKKAMVHAFIGLAVVISAYTIFSAIRIALIGDKALDCDQITGSNCMDGGDMVVNLIQWVGGVGGAVAAIFIVVGAWGYMTASGDPNKLEQAKKTILYALIGLVVVALAEIITAFVSGVIRDANSNAGIQTVQEIAINQKGGINEKT
ncbi:hypothetical protein IKG07_01890 [Candidatus Saccharibacteria bacterium]|nr:hypothetical protein [Candidatus Saccharibacteria bacterium]